MRFSLSTKPAGGARLRALFPLLAFLLAAGVLTTAPADARTSTQSEAAQSEVYDEVWRIVRDRFYDPKLLGLDWKAVGDRHRAALLASALVKVARLACGANIRPLSPAWSAFHAPTLLELRVRQLVSGTFRQPVPTRTLAWSTLALALGVPASLWLVEFSHTLHVVTEAMVTHLP